MVEEGANTPKIIFIEDNCSLQRVLDICNLDQFVTTSIFDG